VQSRQVPSDSNPRKDSTTRELPKLGGGTLCYATIFCFYFQALYSASDNSALSRRCSIKLRFEVLLFFEALIDPFKVFI
jgi:hypothetical protein